MTNKTSGRAPRRERGALSLESAGLIFLAALLVGAITVAITHSNVGGRVADLVCTVLTGGQGSCSAGEGSSAPDAHVPTEPCTAAAEGYEVSGEVAAGVSAGGNKKVSIERLSNGQYAVNVTSGGTVGVAGGVGWDASVNVNGSGYGWDIGADANARLQGGVTQTYLVNSKSQAEDIRNWSIYQDSRDALLNSTGTGWASHIPGVTWASDTVAEWAGLKQPPTPDSTMVYGGASADASAHDTLGVGQLSASGSVDAVLGVRTNSDGSYVIVGRASAGATAAASAAWKSASFDPNATALIEGSYDKNHNLTSVKFTGTTGLGKEDSTINSWTLPVKSEADRQAANDVLYNVNPATWSGFFNSAQDHGQVTRLTYHDDGTDIEAKVGGKFMADVGISGNLKLPHSKVTGAQYWDGQNFVTWAACQ
ncbi:hypothetical protein ATK17_2563 [Branchiibius hedensis]|uniref:Uncharacterized protein n=1 Tax=Branchiibius hedensis TaxID=672460 RepID=A0A2Y9C200_9MICO|nr:hypothetical protein [Branchiibius hedensis]PWJ26401.1 hypothetical protein ATK17_2563 [Branchiibius hedensis]SSA35213.1 hypothetical protein SAMN04489750_2563 [Branchiibius hedensis]